MLCHKLLRLDSTERQQTSLVPPAAAAWCLSLVVLASVLQAFLAQPEALPQTRADVRADGFCVGWQTAWKVCDQKTDSLDIQPSVQPADRSLPHHKAETGGYCGPSGANLTLMTLRSTVQSIKSLTVRCATVNAPQLGFEKGSTRV